MVNFTRTLEIAGTSGFVQPIKLVQYDATLPVGVFELVENGQPFDIPAGAKAKVRMRKADGKGVYNDAAISGHTVQVVVTQQMTAAFGVGFLNIELSYDGGVKSSEPVQVVVLENAVQQGAIESADEFLTLDEIVKQVETLQQQTATDAAAAVASKTAAASSATAAQAARAGAEAAESRVNAIVAGNEAYTKQETHDRFALALQGTADAAASITIYPDAGSNVVATAHGFTIQKGEGDPTPPTVEALAVSGGNVREIVTGGGQSNLLDYEKLSSRLTTADPETGTIVKPSGTLYNFDIFTGTVGWSTAVPDVSKILTLEPNTNYVVSIDSTNSTIYLATVDQSGSVTVLDGAISAVAKSFALKTSSTGLVTIRISHPTQVTITGLRVTKSNAVYTPYTGAKYGVAVTAKGLSETAKLVQLTAPLCEGDTVITRVKSGCDKVIVLKGDPSENWGPISNPNYARFQAGGITTANNGNVWCNKLSRGVGDNYVAVGDGNKKPSVFLDKTKFTDVEDWTSELAQAYSNGDPYILYYQSADYSEKKDKPISLETHQRMGRVLDGTEAFSLAASPANLFQTYSLVNGKDFTVASNQYKNGGNQWSLMPDFSVLNSGSILGFRDSRFSTAEEFKADLAARRAAGAPVTIEYGLAYPLFYARDPVDFIANPGEDGAWVITGEANGKVSAVFNKSLTHTIAELQAALLAVSAKLSL